jgi:hypothetical protein
VAGIPKEETDAGGHSQSFQRSDPFRDADAQSQPQSQPFRAPEELRAAKDSFEERVAVVRPSHGVTPPPEKKGVKI